MILCHNISVTNDFNEFYASNFGFIEYKHSFKSGSRISTTSSNVSIHNSVFCECKCTDNAGGAIYCTSGSIFLAEDSSFSNCSASSSGGAIFCSYSKSLLSRVCAFGCLSTSSNGQSFYIYVSSDVFYNNCANDSSISSTQSTASSTRYSLCVESGNILLTRDNISKNCCDIFSTLYINPTDNSASTSYSSFVNNTAKSYVCFRIYDSQQICTCNIINNQQNTATTPSTICTNENLYICESCIIGNNDGMVVFYEESASCRISLFSCTIDPNIVASMRYTKSLTINQMNVHSFINGIEHFSTYLCGASYDSFGSLTAIAEKKTNNNKGLCVTLGKGSNGVVLEAIKGMKYIIMNSLIQPDSSSGRVPRS